MSKKFERLCARYGAYFRVAIGSAMSSFALLETDEFSEAARFIDSVEDFEMILIPSSETDNVVLGVRFIMSDGQTVSSVSEDGFQAYIDEGFLPITTDLEVSPKTREGAILHIIEVLSGYLQFNFYTFDLARFADFLEKGYNKNLYRVEHLEDYLVVSFPRVFGRNSPYEVVFMLDEARSLSSFVRGGVRSELGITASSTVYCCAEFDAGAGLTTFEKPEDNIFAEDPGYYDFAKSFSRIIFDGYREYLPKK